MARKRGWKKFEFEVQQQKNYLKENSGNFFFLEMSGYPMEASQWEIQQIRVPWIFTDAVMLHTLLNTILLYHDCYFHLNFFYRNL